MIVCLTVFWCLLNTPQPGLGLELATLQKQTFILTAKRVKVLLGVHYVHSHFQSSCHTHTIKLFLMFCSRNERPEQLPSLLLRQHSAADPLCNLGGR